MTLPQELLQGCEEHDVGGMLERLAGRHDGRAALRAAIEAMRELYWNRKDLAGSVVFGRSGAAFALVLAAACQTSDPTLAAEYRGLAKAMHYDVASFTWPGWGEPGITITPGELRFGLDSARANLRLAIELNKPDLPLSRACWMLAGHELCAGAHDQARHHYQKAGEYAVAAKSGPDELLCAGFVAIVDFLCGSDAAAARDRVEQTCVRLAASSEGEGFAKQIKTALEVFAPS